MGRVFDSPHPAAQVWFCLVAEQAAKPRAAALTLVPLAALRLGNASQILLDVLTAPGPGGLAALAARHSTTHVQFPSVMRISAARFPRVERMVNMPPLMLAASSPAASRMRVAK